MEQLLKIMRIGHIDITTKWFELGTVLVDSYSVIKRIEFDHHNDVTTCCRIMFEKWLDMKPEANWSKLVTALNDIKMNAAADFITKQFKTGMVSICIIQLLGIVVSIQGGAHWCTYLTNFVFYPTNLSFTLPNFQLSCSY